MNNSEILCGLSYRILFIKHSISYKPDTYTKSDIYININKLLSEYANANPYT